MQPPSREPSCQLLVQECLQRFEETEPALEWCLKRPSSGSASLVLADRSGEVATVAISGDSRRVVSACDGVAVAGLDPEGQAQLRKRAKEAGGLEPSATAAVIEGQAAIWLDCKAAELQLREPGCEPISLRLS